MTEDRQLINNKDRIQIQDSLAVEHVLLVSKASIPTTPFCVCVIVLAYIIRLLRLIRKPNKCLQYSYIAFLEVSYSHILKHFKLTGTILT